MNCQIILIKNNFKLLKPLTWLSWIIRKVTKSNWNHCAILYKNKVADMSTSYKYRNYDIWLSENNDREFIISKEVDSIFFKSDLEKILENKDGDLEGYEYTKLLNHLTKIKLNKVYIKEIENRMVCSEFVEYIINGTLTNWETPQSLYEKYFR